MRSTIDDVTEKDVIEAIIDRIGEIERKQVSELIRNNQKYVNSWGLSLRGISDYAQLVDENGFLYRYKSPGKDPKLAERLEKGEINIEDLEKEINFTTFVKVQTYRKSKEGEGDFHPESLDPNKLDIYGKPKNGNGNGHPVLPLCKTIRKSRLDESPQLLYNIIYKYLTTRKSDLNKLGPRQTPLPQLIRLMSDKNRVLDKEKFKKYMILYLKQGPSAFPVDYGLVRLNRDKIKSARDLMDYRILFMEEKQNEIERTGHASETYNKYFTPSIAELLSPRSSS